MKKSMLLILLPLAVVAWIALGNMASAKQLAVAVVDFYGADTSADLGRAIAENLRAALMKSDEFSVISRDHVVRVIKEKGATLSLLEDVQTAAGIGSILGAELVLVGSISDIDSVFLLSYRLVEVKTGTVVQAETFEVLDLEDIPSILEQVPALILGKQAFVKYKSVQLTSLDNEEVLRSVLLEKGRFYLAYARSADGVDIEADGYIRVIDSDLNFVEEIRVFSDWPWVHPQVLFSDENGFYLYFETIGVYESGPPRIIKRKTRLNEYDRSLNLRKSADFLRGAPANHRNPFSILCARDQVLSCVRFDSEWLALRVVSNIFADPPILSRLAILSWSRDFSQKNIVEVASCGLENEYFEFSGRLLRVGSYFKVIYSYPAQPAEDVFEPTNILVNTYDLDMNLVEKKMFAYDVAWLEVKDVRYSDQHFYVLRADRGDWIENPLDVSDNDVFIDVWDAQFESLVMSYRLDLPKDYYHGRLVSTRRYHSIVPHQGRIYVFYTTHTGGWSEDVYVDVLGVASERE